MTTNARPLQGSLKEFSLLEVLQMIGLGSMTGAVHLKHASGRVGIIYIDEGRIANCSELDSGALTFGDVLQQLGMATNAQLEQAFSQQLHDAFGKRIGERLMAMGIISESQLQEAIRVQALWTMRELGLWQDGAYEFVPSPNGQSLLPYGLLSLRLDATRVTMEMVRYSDEWSRLRQFLPQGVRTMLQMAETIPYAMSIDTRTFELLINVNLNRRVRRIATAMRRPELDMARELAQLVQQKLIACVFQEAAPRVATSSRLVRLPDPAEKLRMESFELLNLLSRMEQEWSRRHTPMEQLPAFVEFINWTMDALAETCRARGAELDPNTLEALLYREKLRYMGNYRFKIDQNHIDVENFTALCYEVMGGDMKKSAEFYDEASAVLQRILRCIFAMINARVASLDERLENKEVWEAMFTQFAAHRPT